MSELRKLTWKYFWQQKFKEVIIALLIIAAIVFVPYFVGVNLPGVAKEFMIEFVFFEERIISSHFEYWMLGFLPVVIIGGISTGICMGIRNLIKSNWDKASKRAEEELRQGDPELNNLYGELLL